MNYFELHVGDYEAATAHLSMLEDAAYGRMLRIYYRTERPLPADIKQVCRLVRAVSKPERDAVQTVLGEFFFLQDDGWHQARCDAELISYAAMEPEREAKKANEEARLKRHREERAELFRALNSAGQHAPWNTRIEALRSMVKALQGGPETEATAQPATAPATPATATHGNVSPPPTSHLPTLIPSEPIGSGSADAPPDPADLIFGLGVPLLTAAGVSDRNARSMLGMQRKTHGDMAVIDALQRCADEKPLQPVPWLQAALKARVKPPNRQAAIEEENRRVALAWAHGGAT